MSTNRQELLEQLLILTDPTKEQVKETGSTVPQNESDNISDETLLSGIPGPTSDMVKDIMSSFEALQSENTSLAEEIINCYNQLNASFETSSSIAKCNSIQQAILMLMSKVGRAIGSQFCIFIKMTDFNFSLTNRHSGKEDETIFYNIDLRSMVSAEEFYDRNKDDLHELAQKRADCVVSMMDYHREMDPDYEGRGNVTSLILKHSDDNSDLGCLFFVRNDEHEPFVASEMNLAKTLIKLGSIVLGNIMYAQKMHQTYLQTITSLVRAMEEKDSYTSGHSNRVAALACKLGEKIGLDEQVEILEWAGLLHDIGKIGIRDEVLCKPGKLTDEEFEHIKTHPVKSYNVLEPIDALQCILGAAKHHHEHFDGSGYPDGLAGEDIPLHARVIQVADVWDAITSSRSYRKAMPLEKAINIMKEESGTTMDPYLVKEFLELLDKGELDEILEE